MPASVCRLNAPLLLKMTGLSSSRLPVPLQFMVPAFVIVPPIANLEPAPDPVRVEPAGMVKVPLNEPPVHVAAPASVAVPAKVPDCNTRFVFDVTVPLKVLLVATPWEPLPVNCVPF